MDFQLADYFAHKYYMGDNNYQDSLGFSSQQRMDLVEMTSIAHKRDDQWIIDYLEDKFNYLILIGWFIHARSKLDTMNMKLFGSKQVSLITYDWQLAKLGELDPLRNKALLLYSDSKDQKFIDIATNLSSRGIEVKVDHPIWI